LNSEAQHKYVYLETFISHLFARMPSDQRLLYECS